MKLFILTAALLAAFTAEKAPPSDPPKQAAAPADAAKAIDRGLRWLASTQGKNGGWGQDGGETSYIRQSDRQETSGNDVANTAVAALALWKSGKAEYKPNVDRAVEFILKSVEASPMEGLAVTNVTGSQIQRKLGPFIDTFFAARLLGEVEGTAGMNRATQVRVRAALEKCTHKIQANQMKDGSWNIGGGWAPILGTSMASQSLRVAKAKGLKVDDAKLDAVAGYTRQAAAAESKSPGARSEASAGVSLYSRAQQLEELSRSEKDRKANAREIGYIARDLGNERVVQGFGSMGGEEFFSYLNVSDSLKRTGGAEWKQWNSAMKTRLVNLQNNDGTWAGHHCITGRVAVTSAAVLTMLVETGN
jgi:hypothetical protein